MIEITWAIIGAIFLGIPVGMMIEHVINESRWKRWKTRIKRLETAGFWDTNEQLSVQLLLNSSKR